jgi:hypothetical protein
MRARNNLKEWYDFKVVYWFVGLLVIGLLGDWLFFFFFTLRVSTVGTCPESVHALEGLPGQLAFPRAAYLEARRDL